MPIIKYGKHYGFYLPEVFINRWLKKNKNPGDGKMVSLWSVWFGLNIFWNLDHPIPNLMFCANSPNEIKKCIHWV